MAEPASVDVDPAVVDLRSSQPTRPSASVWIGCTFERASIHTRDRVARIRYRATGLYISRILRYRATSGSDFTTMVATRANSN